MTFDDDRAVLLLEDMVRAPSVCGNEGQVAEVLRATLAEAGLAVERDAVGNVVAQVEATGEQVGPTRHVFILGHMDTAPGWIQPEVRHGALYGRGTVDAKGPLATAVVAALRAHSRCRITVIGAVQEEGPSLGARHLLALPAPDCLIIAEPSSWDAIVLGYKGSQRFTVTITVPAAHTSGPEPTASERAVGFWNELVAWCAAQNLSERAQQSSHGFDCLTARLISMTSSTDGLSDTASLHIGLRLPLQVTIDHVRAAVVALLPTARFEFSPGEPAVRGEKRSAVVAAFLRAIRTEGGTPRFKVKTGTSDMNVVGPVWRCPMVAYGPGDSALDHTPEEHLAIPEYLRAVRILTRVLEDL